MDFSMLISKLQSEKNWLISYKEQPSFELPEEVHDRYKSFPGDFTQFITNYQSVTDSNETTWLLCSDDYSLQDKDAFRWNEWERLSIQAALDDKDSVWQENIRKFWDKHLPILMSVADGYEYYAIRISDGIIVRGCEPEFEDCLKVADSFAELIEKIITDEIVLA